MVTGPSIGPAMVLTFLMRWPALIVVCALGGTVYVAYDHVNIDDVKGTFHSMAEMIKPSQRDDQARTVKGLIQHEVVPLPTPIEQAAIAEEHLKSLQRIQLNPRAVKAIISDAI